MRDYHVLTKAGNAASEVAAIVQDIGSPELAGLHRQFFVTRANQTVVMAEGPDAAIVRRLRARPGWMEPGAARGSETA